MKKVFIILCLIAITTGSLFPQESDFPKLTGPYLGQTLPDKIPVKFPFDYMPQGYKLHSSPAFTTDGKEVYFSAMDFSIRFSEKIFVIKMIDGTWSSPQIASFSGNFFDGSPSISRDGKYFFFLKLVSVPWQGEVFWVSVDANT